MSDIRIVLCNCPDKQVAERIARLVVQKKLAACVNIIEGISSVYRWQDEVVAEQEVQLLIKTLREQVTPLYEVIADMHPYDTPEWLVLDSIGASQDYIDWMRSCIK